jgi:multidrug resistance efflux pump
MATGAASVLLICVAVWSWFGRVDMYVQSKEGIFEVTNYAHLLQPQVDGMLMEATATLGAHVDAGQVIYSLDSQAQSRQLEEEQARRASSARLVIAIEDQIRAQSLARDASDRLTTASETAARARVRVAETSFSYSARRNDILAALQEHDLVTGLDSLQGQEERSMTSAQVSEQRSELLLARRSGQLSVLDRDVAVASLQRDLATVQGQIETSDARIAELQYEIERRNIRAPVSGFISSLSTATRGATVHAGETLGSVVPAEPIRVVARFNQRDAVGRVQAGQPVVLRVDQFPWSQYGTLQGKVVSVASVASDGLIRADVEVVGSNPNIAVGEGLTGIAEVRTESLRPIYLLLRLAGQFGRQ